MANIKSQIKRIKTNEKRRVRNKAIRSSVRTHIKKFSSALEANDTDSAEQAFRVAGRELDRAVAKGVVHKNNAANRKSSMAKRLG